MTSNTILDTLPICEELAREHNYALKNDSYVVRGKFYKGFICLRNEKPNGIRIGLDIPRGLERENDECIDAYIGLEPETGHMDRQEFRRFADIMYDLGGKFEKMLAQGRYSWKNLEMAKEYLDLDLTHDYLSCGADVNVFDSGENPEETIRLLANDMRKLLN